VNNKFILSSRKLTSVLPPPQPATKHNITMTTQTSSPSFYTKASTLDIKNRITTCIAYRLTDNFSPAIFTLYSVLSTNQTTFDL